MRFTQLSTIGTVIEDAAESILSGASSNVRELGGSPDERFQVRLNLMKDHGDTGLTKGVKKTNGTEVFGFGPVLAWL